MENKAYDFLKNLNVNDLMIVRIFTPWNYEQYHEYRYDRYHKIDILSDTPDLLSDMSVATDRADGKAFLSELRETLGYEKPDIDIESLFQDNPDLDLTVQWDKLQHELFELQVDDRLLYVRQLIQTLQWKYIELGMRFKSSLRNKDQFLSEALDNCMSIYTYALINIVDKVFFQFDLSFPMDFILIQNESYKQTFEEDPDHYQDPHSLFPDLMNIMTRNRPLLCKNKEDIRFVAAFSGDQLKVIFKHLVDSKLIEDCSNENHFLYWFGADMEKPQDLKPINWKSNTKRPAILLAYFVERYCDKVVDVKISKWKLIEHVFLINGNLPNTNSMKTQMSKSDDRNFNGKEVIDLIFDS